ncbi:UbiA family prenyltransferase [Streptomyces sp. C11-1]|uniref:UbiA family prenyltransferase n=1 Tax=Streptomyces durocortorensis TaxID=2811104 RepID=A0ABY9W5P1_9ACTN|nr:UbiA family prenyltransferase [Streptomyces durocortorensis]WNF30502.1 UbiA family prenyltransferase [Streptomyces durocortorensis]
MGRGAAAVRGSGVRPGSGAPRAAGRGAYPARAPRPARLRAWAELLRVSALFSAPGDALAGAAAVGRRPGRGTALAMGASLCLYEAGMALNDWADRDEDAVDRPHRPIPSGRVSPAAALGAAGVLTAAGLALAARAGRPALTVATGLAATVWAYDLHLKHTKAGPAAMAAARSLDLLLGATAAATGATGAAASGRRGRRPDNVAAAASSVAGTSVAAAPAPAAGTSVTAAPAPAAGIPAPVRGALSASLLALPALPSALALGAHTYGVTAVSRHEAQGGSTGAPLAVLATTTALAAAVLREPLGQTLDPPGTSATTVEAGTTASFRRATASFRRATSPNTRAFAPGTRATSPNTRTPSPGARHHRPGRPTWSAAPLRLLVPAFTGVYLRTAGPPLLHAALNPSPPLTQRAVGGGIRAMIPLQAALAARAGSPVTGLVVMGLVPLARTLARKVSLT